MIYLVSGWPGAGKSTVAVQHAIYRYACQGRRVVANFPIDFSPVAVRRGARLSQAAVQVIPDRPSRADLDALGVGGAREDLAGMLVIDEAGGWLNSRTWNAHNVVDFRTGEKVNERDRIIDWLTQSRKRYWDIYLIAQAPAMLDKQVREAVCECVVRIRRFDRFKVCGVSMPRVHIAIVRYGLEAQAPVIERWFYRGTEAQRCFGSYRVFGADAYHYSILPADQVKWRGKPKYTPNGVYRTMATTGIVGALCLLSLPKLACAWLLLAGLAGRLWGYDISHAKGLRWAKRYRRWRGWDAVTARPEDLQGRGWAIVSGAA